MVTNSIKSNKTNNYLSPQIIKHKKYNVIFRMKSRSRFGQAQTCGEVQPVNGTQYAKLSSSNALSARLWSLRRLYDFLSLHQQLFTNFSKPLAYVKHVFHQYSSQKDKQMFNITNLIIC